MHIAGIALLVSLLLLVGLSSIAKDETAASPLGARVSDTEKSKRARRAARQKTRIGWEQETFLRDHGCDETQGYYFSRPIAGDEFADLLRRSVASQRSSNPPGGDPVDQPEVARRIGHEQLETE